MNLYSTFERSFHSSCCFEVAGQGQFQSGGRVRQTMKEKRYDLTLGLIVLYVATNKRRHVFELCVNRLTFLHFDYFRIVIVVLNKTLVLKNTCLSHLVSNHCKTVLFCVCCVFSRFPYEGNINKTPQALQLFGMPMIIDISLECCTDESLYLAVLQRMRLLLSFYEPILVNVLISFSWPFWSYVQLHWNWISKCFFFLVNLVALLTCQK